MNTEKKESHFLNLVKLAASDGEMSEEEKEIVIGVAKRFGITPDRAIEIAQEAHSIPFAAPESSALRKVELKECVELIKADGRVDFQEVTLLHEIGKKLGFSVNQIDKAIEGKDPGEPSSIILTSKNKSMIEISVCAVAVAAAIIAVSWLGKYVSLLDSAETEQKRVNREIAEMIEKERQAKIPLTTIEEELAGWGEQLESLDNRLQTVNEIEKILRTSL